MTRFGTSVRRVDERIPGISLPLMSVSQTRGVIRRSELTDKPPRAETLDVYKVCRKGDLVFNKMSIRAGALGVAPEDGLITYHYEVMRPRDGADARYLVYLVKSVWFTGELVSRERGIGAGDQANVRTTEVPFSVLRTIDAYIPQLAQQQAIADFLDRETAQIDNLIDKQNALIELLGERRKAVIARAVTRGLDDGVAKKESGVVWLGDVPDHWAVGRISYFGKVDLGKMVQPSPSSPLDVLAPYMRAANVQPDGEVDLSSKNHMWFRVGELAGLRLEAGDVVVVEGGMGGYGRSAYLTHAVPGWGFQNSINRIRVNSGHDSRYLNYVLLMARFVGFIAAYCTGVSMPHLTAEKLERIVVPAPPEEDQRRIADYLDKQTAQTSALVEKARATINLLQERRAALITAAVTGQIDVRGAA